MSSCLRWKSLFERCRTLLHFPTLWMAVIGWMQQLVLLPTGVCHMNRFAQGTAYLIVKAREQGIELSIEMRLNDWKMIWILCHPVAYGKGHFEKLTRLSVSMPFGVVLSHRHLLYLRRTVCLVLFWSPQAVCYRSRLQSNYRESGSWMERLRTEKNERME